MTTVTLYTKPDCCLCDEALEVLERRGKTSRSISSGRHLARPRAPQALR